jgi:hypothetical protein
MDLLPCSFAPQTPLAPREEEQAVEKGARNTGNDDHLGLRLNWVHYTMLQRVLQLYVRVWDHDRLVPS